MVGFRIRAACEEDIEQLVEIEMCAYPVGGNFDRYQRNLTQNPFGGLGDVRVIERDGRIVGHAALYMLEVWLGGRRVPAGGIASVAISPEARRQGMARALIHELHTEANAREAALTLLYPFRERFYACLGYATTGPLLSLRVAAEALAPLRTSGAGDGLTFSPIDGALLRQARELYEDVARRHAGRIARSEARWLALFARESRHFTGAIAADGKLHGYVAFSYDAPILHDRQTLVVHELVAQSGEARRALLSVLGNQRDQVDDVEITVTSDDPLPFALLDAPGSRRGTPAVHHPLGQLGAGPMVRLADIRRALEARGYSEDGDLTILIEDAQAEALHLAVRSGTAQIAEAGGAPEMKLSRATLGSIVAAGIAPGRAAELGLLRAGDAALRTAERLFSGPRFQCLDPF